MKDKIINILKIANNSLSTTSLAKLLMIDNEENYQIMVKNLKQLEDSGLIICNPNQTFTYIDETKLLQGTLLLNRKGFGFIKVENMEQQYFVNSQNLNQALDYDLVLFMIIDTNNDKKNYEAKIIKVLKRHSDKLIGTIIFDQKTNKKILEIQNIKMQHYLGNIINYEQAIVNTIVETKIISVNENIINLEIIKIIGNINSPGIDILAIVAEYDIRNKFPEPVLQAAQNIKQVINKNIYKNYRNLEQELFVTIDGADAKDLDDAITVKKLKNGNYKLLVAIADVAHYVTPNSILDQEAFLRGNSVYLVDRVIPMLPEQLSNGICSLNANEQRLVIVCELEINRHGKTINPQIYQAVIKVKKRLTYDVVNKFYEKKQKIQKEIAKMLLQAQKLFYILKTNKIKAGVIDFDLKEAKVIIDHHGKVKNIITRERKTAEMLIESFMIKANETVAETIYWLNLPFIYRIHEQPKIEKLRNLYNLLKIIGFNIKGKIDHIHSKDLQTVLKQAANNPGYDIIASLFLRSMEKAKYSNINKGHFGLASNCYTHFTSPIRRYSDLIVHQTLKKYLFYHQNFDNDILNNYNNYLAKVADQTSMCEIKATECERAVEQMKKAEYMEQHLNEHFSGIISSITSFGLFVSLDNTIEGFVSLSDLKDDYYIFHEQSLSLIGEHKRRQYRIGQRVNIIVKAASKHERKIDFILINQNQHRRRK